MLSIEYLLAFIRARPGSMRPHFQNPKNPKNPKNPDPLPCDSHTGGCPLAHD